MFYYWIRIMDEDILTTSEFGAKKNSEISL